MSDISDLMYEQGYHDGYQQALIELNSKKFEKVVRCKDCKYLIDHPLFMDDGYCEKMRNYRCIKLKPERNWFCADGKRKAGEKDGSDDTRDDS